MILMSQYALMKHLIKITYSHGKLHPPTHTHPREAQSSSLLPSDVHLFRFIQPVL